MNCISRQLKRLYEEKLILAKEDGEGGAPAGGDTGGGEITAPADGGDGASADAADVLPPGMKPTHTGLATTDVLGKCDHKKDGVFGPGCFHLPCVWSIPYYRLPKKKKKRRKFPQMTIVQEGDEYAAFERDVKWVVEDEIEKAQEWLKKIDPEIQLGISQDYEFDGEQADWVAALDMEDQDDIKSFQVAFNLHALFDFLDDLGLELDNTEIRLQIRVSLWHELGHALLDYFRDNEIYDFEVSGVKEEQLCEDFARNIIKEYSGVTNSELMNFIRENFLDGKDIRIKESQVVETKGDVETDFTKPINLADQRRFLGSGDEKLKGTQNFVMKNILVPGSANIFSDQNGKDVYVSINRHGMMRLQVEAEPQDSDEADFLSLPEGDQARFVDIVLNVERYAADPKDEFELETASEFESVPLEQRQDLARRYQSLIGGFRTLWYRPTLIDTIRIAHAAGKILLPLELLIVLDKNDHDNKKRYIESVNESDYGHSFVRDMYRLQTTKGHFAQERWSLLRSDFISDSDLGFLEYKVRLAKNLKGSAKDVNFGTNYIFSNGVLFGYNDTDTSIQTVYYIEPSEVVYMLRDGDILYGNKTLVSVGFLWNCLQNLVQKKAFAGHWDRRSGY